MRDGLSWTSSTSTGAAGISRASSERDAAISSAPPSSSSSSCEVIGMHPILFEIGNWLVAPTACRWRSPILPACSWPVREERRPGRRSRDGSRHLPHHRGVDRREAHARRRRFRSLPPPATRAASLVRAAGVFTAVCWPCPAAVVRFAAIGFPWPTDVPCAWIALGHVVGRLGCLLAGYCYGRPTDLPLGHHVHRPGRGGERGHTARRPIASHAALKPAAELITWCFLLVTERRARPFPGRTLVGLLLYAVSRFRRPILQGATTGACSGLSTSQAVSLVGAVVARHADSPALLRPADAGPCAGVRPARSANASRSSVPARRAAAAAPVQRDVELAMTAADAGQRLDVVLTRYLPELSRSEINV